MLLWFNAITAISLSSSNIEISETVQRENCISQP